MRGTPQRFLQSVTQFLKKPFTDTALASILSLVDAALPSIPEEERFALFDFDNTCVIHDIQQALMAYMCRGHKLRHFAMLPHAYEPDRTHDYHREVFVRYWNLIAEGAKPEAYLLALRTLVGFREEEIQNLYEAIIREQGTILGKEELFGVPITRGFQTSRRVIQFMQHLVDRGIRVCVVSASPEVLVRAAIHHRKIPARMCIGTNLQLIDGTYTDEPIQPAPIEAGKIICIKNAIGEERRPVVAVGDTMNDYVMLEYATIPVAIDRGNELAEKARAQGWSIITHNQ